MSVRNKGDSESGVAVAASERFHETYWAVVLGSSDLSRHTIFFFLRDFFLSLFTVFFSHFREIQIR